MKAGDLMAAFSAKQLEQQDLNYILADLLHCPIPELAFRRGQELSPEQEILFHQYSSRLQKGEPPQYILGKAWFYGLELEVDPAVLIPRPETEGLVELALRHIRPGQKVLEIGTGSGAISIALHKARPEACYTATELSSEALQIARRNAARHKCAIDFQLADLFPSELARFDLIVSNPPYVSPQEYAKLEPRVRDFEPRLALYADDGGLAFYRRILETAPQFLPECGLVCFEHGYSQRQPILELAGKLGWACLEALQDLSGRNRYLLLQKSAASVTPAFET